MFFYKKKFNVLMKTWYFNTRFVSLRYKNTNQYFTKLIEKYTGKSQNVLRKFLKLFFFAGSSSIHVAGLDPADLTRSLAQASDSAGQTRGTYELPHVCMLIVQVNYNSLEQ
jgi:hypothetical protein